MKKTGAIILSRMGSSRMPGKAMACLYGAPVLQHVVQRIKRAQQVHQVIVATTTHSQDDIIEYKCSQWGISCFRGAIHNVLKRCTEASLAFDLEVVVRIGGDSPLVDPELIDRMVQKFDAVQPDYLSNTMDRVFPLGLDVEIFQTKTFITLSSIIKGLSEEERRLNEENVIVYMHQHPDEFKLANFKESWALPEARLTLDTPSDFILIEKIYNALYPQKPSFNLEDILYLLKRNPHWLSINSDEIPVSGFWTETEKKRFEQKFGKHLG